MSDPALPSQGYVLTIDPDRVRLRHADAAGRRYGRQTLARLNAQNPQGLPLGGVSDWPDFRSRGYMLDVSRNRVPRRAFLETLVGRLAALRFNHLELYVEASFAYRDHEPVWRDTSPLTAEDLSWLDTLCSDNGIRLGGNQATFGHMERWLRNPAYRDRAECPSGWEPARGRKRPAAVLAPTDENAAFALSLVCEQMAALSSRWINVNCDETFELGQGRSRARVEAEGRGAVYFGHLKRLIEPLSRDGYEVAFWGDIARRHPERLDDLKASGATALLWHYEAPLDPDAIPPEMRAVLSSLGMKPEDLAGFSSYVPPFAERDFPFWVAPGTSTWNSFTGRLTNAEANLEDAAAIGLGTGADGLLVTDWGDRGHHQPLSASLPPLVRAAGLAWCAESNAGASLCATIDALILPEEEPGLGALLEDLGRTDDRLGVLGFNASPLHNALIGSTGFIAGEPSKGRLEETASALLTLAEKAEGFAAVTPEGALIASDIALGARLARYGALRLAGRSGEGEALSLSDLKAAFRSQWLKTSRPGGLEASLAAFKAAPERAQA